MPSYEERNELIKALSNQAYFDAINKPKALNKAIQDVGIDGQTGRTLLSHPDGGLSSNGVKRFNTASPSDGFVAARIDPYSNAIAIDGRQRREDDRVNRIIEEEVTSNIIFLFREDNITVSGRETTMVLSIGGDRADLEEVYRGTLYYPFVSALRIHKTGLGIDDWVITFLYDAVVSAPDIIRPDTPSVYVITPDGVSIFPFPTQILPFFRIVGGDREADGLSAYSVLSSGFINIIGTWGIPHVTGPRVVYTAHKNLLNNNPWVTSQIGYTYEPSNEIMAAHITPSIRQFYSDTDSVPVELFSADPLRIRRIEIIGQEQKTAIFGGGLIYANTQFYTSGNTTPEALSVSNLQSCPNLIENQVFGIILPTSQESKKYPDYLSFVTDLVAGGLLLDPFVDIAGTTVITSFQQLDDLGLDITPFNTLIMGGLQIRTFTMFLIYLAPFYGDEVFGDINITSFKEIVDSGSDINVQTMLLPTGSTSITSLSIQGIPPDMAKLAYSASAYLA